MVNELQTLWDGQLRRKVAAKHLTDLTKPGKSPMHQNSYCAGPRHHKLEKPRTDRMLAKRVIASANAEWFSPIFFRQSRTYYIVVVLISGT